MPLIRSTVASTNSYFGGDFFTVILRSSMKVEEVTFCTSSEKVAVTSVVLETETVPSGDLLVTVGGVVSTSGTMPQANQWVIWAGSPLGANGAWRSSYGGSVGRPFCPGRYRL